MNKQESLQVLFDRMEEAPLPLREQSPLVPGEGNPDAKILFIGEAAGYHEARLKRPFVGQAGKLLDRLLEENGLNRSNVWITNVVKARPPQNRDPQPEEIEQYRPYLEEELAIIKPRYIATLGRFAMNWFLQDAVISRTHGQARRLVSGLTLFPLYHPAAALRNGNMMEALRADFTKLVKLVKEGTPTETVEVEEPALESADEPAVKSQQQTLF